MGAWIMLAAARVLLDVATQHWQALPRSYYSLLNANTLVSAWGTALCLDMAMLRQILRFALTAVT